MKLYIGNKNYSSWSLRAWLLLKEFGIDFEEIELQLDPTAGSAFKKALEPVSPVGRVPVLVDDGFAVWDSLAIAEYLADKFPEKALWPADAKQRARARSLCAEMHSGFVALRSHFGMNVEASLPEVGARVMRQQPDVVADVDRIEQMWSGQLAQSRGPFLFGAFSIADAFYAPICTRLRTYAPAMSVESSRYVSRVMALKGMQAWTWDALSSNGFIRLYEPYRSSPQERE